MEDSDLSDEIIGKIFFKKYKVTKKLGQGSFGQVFKGTNITTNEEIAFKFEPKDENNNLLETEAYRLIYLKGDGVPKVICYGNNSKYNILVFQLLGRSLEDLFNLCGRKFSLKTTCILGIQMVERLQYVHEKCHIHRDIKPDNFVMGFAKDENKVYVIDFGLAKKYKSQTKNTHIPFKTGKNMTGTARYCSIGTHEGFEQSRRDDLESIGYVLMYFMKGVLPWQGLKCRHDEDHYVKIHEKKKSTPVDELCKGYPSEFADYIKHCKELKFDENPNYEYLIELLKKVILEKCSASDPDYDWNNKLKSDTNLNLPKVNTNTFNKIPNKSMILNNKSTNTPYDLNDVTGISPNHNDLQKMSIFQDREERNEELENSIELEDKNKFLNGNSNSNNKESVEKKQEENMKKNEAKVQEVKNNNNEKGNKMHNEVNHNPVANSKNIADSAREKKIEYDTAKESGNIVNKEVSKVEKNKTYNKKGNDEACKCVMF